MREQNDLKQFWMFVKKNSFISGLEFNTFFILFVKSQ